MEKQKNKKSYKKRRKFFFLGSKDATGTGEWHIDVELLIEFYTCLSNVCTSQSIFRCRKMIGQRYHYESQGTGTLISRMSDVVHLLPCRLAEQ